MSKKLSLYLFDQLLHYTKEANPIWPFGSLLHDGKRPLMMATDCAHISPLFHSESHVIHESLNQFDRDQLPPLTLFSTAEPDVLSYSAIYWANVVGLKINKVIYAVTLNEINSLFGVGIDISMNELHARSNNVDIEIEHFPIPKIKELFISAKKRQLEIGSKNPGRAVLSKNREDFYRTVAANAASSDLSVLSNII